MVERILELAKRKVVSGRRLSQEWMEKFEKFMKSDDYNLVFNSTKMKLQRRLITTFLDDDCIFNGDILKFSINDGEFKDGYTANFNTDFFPKLLDIAYQFSKERDAMDQKTIILEDEDMRLVFNFRELCGFNADDEVAEEDKWKIEKKGLEYVTMCDRIQIDVISDGVFDRDIFLYQIPRYSFCKNILDIIERDLDIYNLNIKKPNRDFKDRAEELNVDTISKEFFLKRKKEIMENINNRLKEDIEECLYSGTDDYGISKEEAEKLKKEFGLE